MITKKFINLSKPKVCQAKTKFFFVVGTMELLCVPTKKTTKFIGISNTLQKLSELLKWVGENIRRWQKRFFIYLSKSLNFRRWLAENGEKNPFKWALVYYFESQLGQENWNNRSDNNMFFFSNPNGVESLNT